MNFLLKYCVVALILAHALADKKVVCYFESWAVYRTGDGAFNIEDIDASLCTHLLYSFVNLGDDGSVSPGDSYADLSDGLGERKSVQCNVIFIICVHTFLSLAGPSDSPFVSLLACEDGYNKVNNLKNQGTGIKIMAALGGGSAGSATFSTVVNDASKRSAFVDNAVNFLSNYGFDGMDIDWEYPASGDGSRSSDKEAFVETLKELRSKFDKHGYLLSVAVGAGNSFIGSSYDVVGISQSVDFINVMTYDFHSGWESYTGENAPLYARSSDSYDESVDSCIQGWLSAGAPAEKIIMGMGLFGISYNLVNADDRWIGSPANGPGAAGIYTEGEGSLGYMEAQYVSDKGLGGAMVWSIDMDDARGTCGTKYHLLKNINTVVVCYLASWSLYRTGNDVYKIEDIDSNLCTHIIYAFANLYGDGTIKVGDSYTDSSSGQNTLLSRLLFCLKLTNYIINYNYRSDQLSAKFVDGYNRLNAFKKVNTNLKTLIAIGGGSAGSTNFSKVFNSASLRAAFVNNAANFVRQNGFNGLDVDWEFPGDGTGSQTSDKVAGVNNWLNNGAPANKINVGMGFYGTAFSLKDASKNGVGAASSGPGGSDGRVVCYFASWSLTRTGDDQYRIEDIDSSLCTHVIYAFADLANGYNRLNRLKQQNPNLKTLIAVGGGSAGSAIFSQVFNSAALRATFVDSAANFVQQNGFNGLDVDWEFPGDGTGSQTSDKYAGVENWLNNGAPAEKIVLGMGFYGTAFILADSNNNGVGAPAIGAGGSGGTLMYNQAQYALDKGLGGAMVWSIDMDDFRGICGDKNVLLQKIKDIIG
uniref:GH18 domain-containing protein n=1 Tax=Timema monikensis TaxID=170555 RepID=A0A7R9HNW1_9NEOP|nr:unnamed protein product [Timema monikensis]